MNVPPRLPLRPRPALLRKRKRPVVPARLRHVPDPFIHRRQLVVADDIAALDVLLVLGALVGIWLMKMTQSPALG